MTKHKNPLPELPGYFDLKFLLYGRSGTGKTDLTATYSYGPIHYYMMDPGGDKTIRKTRRRLNLPIEDYITIDYFTAYNHKVYDDFWKTLQKDAKDGFFDELASRSGMVVFDSATTLGDNSILSVAHKNSRSLTDASDNNKAMRIQDWGQNTAWIRQLVRTISDFPCAVCLTAHTYADRDSQGSVIAEYPKVPGQMRESLGAYMDEVYRLKMTGDKYNIFFRGSDLFEAKSRVISARQLQGVTLDELANAYLKGGDIEKKESKKSNSQESIKGNLSASV